MGSKLTIVSVLKSTHLDGIFTCLVIVIFTQVWNRLKMDWGKIKPHFDMNMCGVKRTNFSLKRWIFLTSEFGSKTKRRSILKRSFQKKYKIYVHTLRKISEIIEKQGVGIWLRISGSQQILTYKFKQNDAYNFISQTWTVCLQWTEDEVTDLKMTICSIDILANEAII